MSNFIVEEFYSMEYGPAPEDPKEVDRWLDGHQRSFDHYIDGAWKKPASGEYFATSDPATGEKIADVAHGDAADVDAAVKAARKALPAWQALSGHQRARYLYALARQVQKHSRRLAVLETMDNGKPIRESRDIDIPLVARHFYHHAGWAQLLRVEFPGYTACGVVGQVIPWNFPLLMFAWKVAPALAAGNTVVIKPAEYTPLTALAFAELAMEVGLPPGVLNVLNGDGRTGALLVEHDDIDKIAFTGSTEVGRIIRKATAARPRSSRLNSAANRRSSSSMTPISTPPSKAWLTASGSTRARSAAPARACWCRSASPKPSTPKCARAWRRCASARRWIKSIDIGAIVAPVQLERIRSLVDQGVAEGATCWQPQSTLPQKGLYFPPTLLTGVHPTATVAQEEIFGPVLAAMTFRTPSEAVELANNTIYGLAASIWSESINVALDVASQVKAGVVWVNCTNLFDASCGFGGYRESGYGREGGREGMYEYLEPTWLHERSKQSMLRKPPRRLPRVRQRTTMLSDTIDRTVKQYIGGKQARPDSGYSFPVYGRDGTAARRSAAGQSQGHSQRGRSRAQGREVGEDCRAHPRADSLLHRRKPDPAPGEITGRLAQVVGEEQAAAEVDAGIERIFTYAAWADKYRRLGA